MADGPGLAALGPELTVPRRDAGLSSWPGVPVIPAPIRITGIGKLA